MDLKVVGVGAGLATLVAVAIGERDRWMHLEVAPASESMGASGAAPECEPVDRSGSGGDVQRAASGEDPHPSLADARLLVAELERQVATANDGTRSESTEARTQRGATELFVPPESKLATAVEGCRVHYVLTPLDAHGDPPNILESDQAERWRSVGLSDDETETINAFFRRTNTEMTQLLRKLFVEATGDDAGVSSLSADALIAEILFRSDDGAARRQVAQERAGSAQPGGDPSQEPAALRLHRARYAAMAGLCETLGGFGEPDGWRCLDGCRSITSVLAAAPPTEDPVLVSVHL